MLTDRDRWQEVATRLAARSRLWNLRAMVASLARIRTSLVLLVLAVLAAVVPTAAAEAHPFPTPASLDLDAATIPSLQQRMDGHTLTATGLTLRYLDRIRKLDPKLHAVIALDPTAVLQAASSDVRRLRGKTRGPLDGIPVLLKDNIDTAYLQTTAGSRALLGPPPVRNATLVSKLKAAGAVILGKANLSEWANYRATNATSGWSGVGGQTNNPYVLDRNPCGSSSGSAVGVAASLAQVAIGTETDGSIVCPAGANGVVGLKPTLGLVSRTGVVPISAAQDTAGPMGRHVVDVALTLAALQGGDPADAATAEIPAGQPTDYAAALAGSSVAGKRIGMWRLAGANTDVDAIVQKSVAALTAAGATVIDVELPYQDEANAAEGDALLREFKPALEAYLATRPGQEKTLAQLITFDQTDPVELSLFNQALFEKAEANEAIGTDRRETATGLQQKAIDETLAAYSLDAIMAPTNGPAWVTSYGNGDDFELGSSGPAATAGYPDITVPAGLVGPLPVGVSFFAGRWSDLEVLRLAAAFEQLTKARQAPTYIPTIGA